MYLVYDHVGMFVKHGERLGVLEALGNTGVIVSNYKAFHDPVACCFDDPK